MLVGLYILYIVVMAILRPESCPPLTMSAEARRTLKVRVFSTLLPPLLLIIAVLGSILTGLATPTESASIGALGAVILAVAKRQFGFRSEEHTSELQSLMRISYAVFCLKNKKRQKSNK